MIAGFCDDRGRGFCSVCRPCPPPGAHLVPASDGFAALAAGRFHRIAPGEFQPAFNVIASAAVLAERVRAEEDK